MLLKCFKSSNSKDFLMQSVGNIALADAIRPKTQCQLLFSMAFLRLELVL